MTQVATPLAGRGRMRLRLLGLSAALCLVSCQRDHYALALEPEDGSLRRRLECWRVVVAQRDVPTALDDFDPEQLEAIAKAYGAPPPLGPLGRVRHRFAGVFREMPSDVGGFGRYDVRITSLGATHAYAERFRGDGDVEAALDRRARAADGIVDVLREWFQAEAGKSPGWAALDRFLGGRFRTDLLNVADLVSQTREWRGGDERTPDDGEVEARIRLYLIEHGYGLDLCDWLLGSAIEVDPEPLRRRLAREMGVEDADPVPASLGFLVKERVGPSWKAFAKASSVLARIEGSRPRPTIGDALTDLAMRDLLGWDHAVPGRLRVTLACEVEPIETNGSWSEDDRTITWDWTDLPRHGAPLVRHAKWSAPDVDAQKSRFGRVVLTGAALHSYVEWRTKLDPGRGGEWDGFVAGLRVAIATPDGIRAFLPADGTAWADPGKKLLIDAVD